MARRIRLWPAASLLSIVAAACSGDIPTDLGDRVASPSTSSFVAATVSTPEVLPFHRQFEAEKGRAAISDLPDQF